MAPAAGKRRSGQAQVPDDRGRRSRFVERVEMDARSAPSQERAALGHRVLDADAADFVRVAVHLLQPLEQPFAQVDEPPTARTMLESLFRSVAEFDVR